MTEKKKLRVASQSRHQETEGQSASMDTTKRTFADSFRQQNQAGEPIKALGIKVTESRHRKLKIIASTRGTTMSELVSQFIDDLEI